MAIKGEALRPRDKISKLAESCNCEDAPCDGPLLCRLQFRGDLLKSHMFSSVCGVTAAMVHKWAEDRCVVLALLHFKEQEIDDPERYDQLKITVGDKNSIEEVAELVKNIVRLSVAGEKNPTEGSAEVQQVRRLANIVYILVGLYTVPGSDVSKTWKPGVDWKHEAAARLLLSVLMDLHRYPDGYFSKLLGGKVVEKWADSTPVQQTTDVKAAFSTPELLEGPANETGEAAAQVQEAHEGPSDGRSKHKKRADRSKKKAQAQAQAKHGKLPATGSGLEVKASTQATVASASEE